MCEEKADLQQGILIYRYDVRVCSVCSDVGNYAEQIVKINTDTILIKC